MHFLWFDFLYFLSGGCWKTEAVFSSYQALPHSLLLQFGSLMLLKESLSIDTNTL